MSNFRTPLKRAAGLGSAKDGTGHFLWQRVTAIAVALCGIYLLGLLFGLTGADYPFARATVKDPVNATVLIAFLVAACWHAKLGLQVVIEDYVHEDGTKFGVIALLNLAIIAGAAFALFCVVRLALGGA